MAEPRGDFSTCKDKNKIGSYSYVHANSSKRQGRFSFENLSSGGFSQMNSIKKGSDVKCYYKVAGPSKANVSIVEYSFASKFVNIVTVIPQKKITFQKCDKVVTEMMIDAGVNCDWSR